MRRTIFWRCVGVMGVLGVAIQLVPYGRNHAVNPVRREPAWDQPATRALVARACFDCHSNQTVWPWYTQVAPLSWLMAYGVKTGRQAVNFSEWAAYPPQRQRELLAESCRDVSTGKMPGAYTRLRPETRLSAQDVATICAAAR